MAAKQGLSAHFSQASEDAKRAVLQHTPALRSSWFSNLNTTCTIKSAPPRTPDVLSLLATHSGWLWKRNEQHVWQARWCCVVPHTFLYYFDNSHQQPQPPALTQAQQDALNQAVKSGYGDKPHAGPRSSFNVFSSPAANNNTAGNDNPDAPNHIAALDKTPAGIIDLECYSSVHRSSENELLLELAGDESINPDLRSFYFYCSTDEESDEWTQSLLHKRHVQLEDELHAYQQVSEGFAQQLQELHMELDTAALQQDEVRRELYSSRTLQEQTRRNGYQCIKERLEHCENAAELPFQEARTAFLQDLESTREMGLLPAIQLLCDYTRVLEQSCVESFSDKKELQAQLQSYNDSADHQTKRLSQLLETQQQEWLEEKTALHNRVETLEQALVNSQKCVEDANQDLALQRMEMKMLQNSSTKKLGELQQHKKILKREVISLRSKLDEVSSELSLLKHNAKTSLEKAQEEARKSALLERHVERMDAQVKVQQTMMELMSCGSQVMNASVGGFSRNYESAATSPRNNAHDEDDVQKQHNQLMQRAQEQLIQEEAKNAVVLEDEKSHMSELTEDRTQKHFEELDRRRTPKRLPSYIGVEDVDVDDHDDTTTEHQHKLETIMSASLPPSVRGVRHQASDSSLGGRMSVAQRARLEADQRVGTPVRVRVQRSNSQSSFLSNFSKSLTDALGEPSDDSEDDDDSYSSEEEGNNNMDIPHSDTGMSEVSAGTSMSLQERQAMQRAKQLAFLREQGLIKEESNLVGGAGGRGRPESSKLPVHR